MYIINSITSDPQQTMQIQAPGLANIGLTIEYVPLQLGWFINSLTYGTDFTVDCLRIVNSPNLLHQWRNIIPFGIACLSSASRDPNLQLDFSSGYANLYILVANEVAAVTSFYQGN